MSKTSHKCRLVLVIPHGLADEKAAGICSLLETGLIACAVLQSGDDGRVDRALAEKLMTASLGQDLAFLVENDVETAKQIKADGVHIAADESLYKQAHAKLGDDVIIGVACPAERHTALVLAETGADYIAFETSGAADESYQDLIRWWAEVVEVPQLAWCAGTPDEAARFAASGADFVAIDPSAWGNTNSMDDTLRSFADAVSSNRVAA